jgi:hypothetical protein
VDEGTEWIKKRDKLYTSAHVGFDVKVEDADSIGREKPGTSLQSEPS